MKGRFVMSQAMTKQHASSEVDRVVDPEEPASSWRTLYRAAGAAALITAVLVPIQLPVFMAYPFPDTVTGWFRLLQDNPLAGLVDLDLLLVVDNILLVVIALALSAGQALLAGWEGTAFQVGYVVGQLAGIMVGVVMLRSSLFGRAIPYTLILGNVVGFGLYLPTVGVAISAFSGVVLWAWYLLIARRFFRLGHSPAASVQPQGCLRR